MEATGLDTNKLCTVAGCYDCCRITAIEVEDFRVSVAVEGRDGVRWYSERDITSTKGAAETRDRGIKDDFNRESVSLMSGDEAATEASS